MRWIVEKVYSAGVDNLLHNLRKGVVLAQEHRIQHKAEPRSDKVEGKRHRMELLHFAVTAGKK